MRLILHIGTEKTGTTSFQNWCMANRATLLTNAILYPQTLGAPSQRYLSTMARGADAPDDSFKAFQIDSADAYSAFVAHHYNAFDAELAQAKADGCRLALISSEHLQSRLLHQDMVARLGEQLSPRFDSVEIWLHLRPQVDVMLSMASTAARHGRPMHKRFFEQEAERAPFYDYDALVTRWESVFGKNAVTLIPFRKQPDITAYAQQALGLDANEFSAPMRVNTAVGLRAHALVSALDRGARLPGLADNIAESLMLDQMSTGERLAIGRTFAEHLHSQYEASNAALGARRDDITADILTPDWVTYPEADNFDQIGDKALLGQALAEMVSLYDARLALETGRTRRTEGEHSVAVGNRSQAARFFALAHLAFERAGRTPGLDHETRYEREKLSTLIDRNHLNEEFRTMLLEITNPDYVRSPASPGST